MLHLRKPEYTALMLQQLSHKLKMAGNILRCRWLIYYMGCSNVLGFGGIPDGVKAWRCRLYQIGPKTLVKISVAAVLLVYEQELSSANEGLMHCKQE